MPLSQKAGPEPALKEVVDLDEDNKPLPVAHAVFTDGERIAFPEGCVFHWDDATVQGTGEVYKRRVRVFPPKDSRGPQILLPLGASKEYVRTVVRRIELGV
jgi:hypothetical protein